MQVFQDYYGDYNEEAPCDPYYEDCATVAREAAMEDDMMMDEEKLTSAKPFLLLWGLIPALDIAAGIETWRDFEQNEDDDSADTAFGECSKCAMRQ